MHGAVVELRLQRGRFGEAVVVAEVWIATGKDPVKQRGGE